MYSLPSLAPRDSYSLWYTPSTAAIASPTEINHNAHDYLIHGQNVAAHQSRRNALHRTPLARLRLDEEYMERRKENIRNYGSSWIKPPGIPKSLYQLREEKREMLEHQEALRREALATELAQAEADAAEAGAEMGQGVDEMEEVRDLDDDIPDAETTGLDADEEESDEEDTNHDVDGIPRAILGARVTDDAYREALARGQQTRSGGFDDEGGTEDEEDNSQMLQEQDLVHEGGQQQQRGMGFDVDLDLEEEQEQDLDLDDEIPEAEDEYEHTDTSAELSSSEESGDETDLPRGGFAPSTSMVRSDGTQNSMDLSSLISNSSQRGSSPRRRSGQPPRR